MIDLLAWILALASHAGIAALAYAAGKRRMAARNAAHAECVECTHRTPKQDVSGAQAAARSHRAETGHLVLVVAKHGPA